MRTTQGNVHLLGKTLPCYVELPHPTLWDTRPPFKIIFAELPSPMALVASLASHLGSNLVIQLFDDKAIFVLEVQLLEVAPGYPHSTITVRQVGRVVREERE